MADTIEFELVSPARLLKSHPVERIFVAGGFCEISPERCTVLAEEVTPVSKIDKAAAEKRLKSANEGENEAERRIAEAMADAASL